MKYVAATRMSATQQMGVIRHPDEVSLRSGGQRAEHLGISLGFENRYYLREIPNLQEMGLLLEEFSGAPVGYWHDVGHAAIQQNLGVQQQKDWLNAHGDSLLGVHLHDAVGYEDHLAPLQGEVHFESMYPFFNDTVIKIFELRPEVPLEAIQKAISYMDALSDTMQQNCTCTDDMKP